ncbi:hypothetical protein [Glycomyces salinus]|uniref:hypothetical protein n=1 Tax=Glycomyces salinus TaxID=980294 RepID=UPI001E35450F|nr:hypothetical protein [Glycomyces salinus]
MIWWVKSRRLWSVAAAMAVFCAGVELVGSRTIPLPVVGAASAIPLVTVLPLLVAVALISSMEPADKNVEGAAARPLTALNLAVVATVLVVTAVSGAVLGDGADAELWDRAVRNLAGVIGYSLILLRIFAGRTANTLMTVVVLLSVSFGRTPDGRLLPWSWINTESGHVWSAYLALGLLATGVAATIAPRRFRPT